MFRSRARVVPAVRGGEECYTKATKHEDQNDTEQGVGCEWCTNITPTRYRTGCILCTHVRMNRISPLGNTASTIKAESCKPLWLVCNLFGFSLDSLYA